MNQRVYVICQDIIPGIYHVQHTKMVVGKWTFQVDGGVSEGKAWCKVKSEKDESMSILSHLKHSSQKYLGRSSKTFAEIFEYIAEYNSKHFPNSSFLSDYGPLANNCQKFVLELSQFLRVDLPPNDFIQFAGSKTYSASTGKRAYVDTSEGLDAGAEVGKCRVIKGPLAVSCEGPSAHVRVRATEGNVCVMAGASLGGSTYQVAGARLEAKPSIETGFAVQKSQVCVKVLGTGVSLGRAGASISVLGFSFGWGRG